MDLEVAEDHDLNAQDAILLRLKKDLNAENLPLTIFTTATAAEAFPERLKSLQDAGHEIGSHGLNHSPEENYKTATSEHIKMWLSESTKRISNITEKKLLSFRGPGMSTSVTAQQHLIKMGYQTDLSVCSQRADFMLTAGGELGWLFSPRNTYQPSTYSALKKGNQPIKVIPMRTFGIPFISGSLYIFGLTLMKLYFCLLLLESKRCNKPIVYLFHSYEHTPHNIGKDNRPLRQKLYTKDHEKKYRKNLDFLKFMTSFSNVKAMRAIDYINN